MERKKEMERISSGIDWKFSEDCNFLSLTCIRHLATVGLGEESVARLIREDVTI